MNTVTIPTQNSIAAPDTNQSPSYLHQIKSSESAQELEGRFYSNKIITLYVIKKKLKVNEKTRENGTSTHNWTMN